MSLVKKKYHFFFRGREVEKRLLPTVFQDLGKKAEEIKPVEDQIRLFCCMKIGLVIICTMS